MIGDCDSIQAVNIGCDFNRGEPSRTYEIITLEIDGEVIVLKVKRIDDELE